MRPARALAGFFGLGLVAFAGLQLSRGALGLPGFEPGAVLFGAMLAAFLSAAVALVTLVPAALDSRRTWLRRTAAVFPAVALGYAVEQGVEAWGPGVQGAEPWTAGLVGAFVVTACAWLLARADRGQRVWMALGLIPGGLLAAVSIATRIGASQLGGMVLAAVLVVGLALESLRGSQEPVEGEPRPSSSTELG